MPQTTESQDEIIVDGTRLRQTFRRQGRLWLWLGPLLAGLLLLLLASLVPRSYTGTVSVALQQPSGGNSAIALLTGGGGGSSKRYLGVLKSRNLAAAVERHVQLRQIYGEKLFPTEEDAAEFLMKSVKPDDNVTDGLLYVAVSLPGPPKLALHPSPTAVQVETAAADAANAYALGLKEYYATSDTDQGAVLLRGADKEVRQARARYEDALSRSLQFTRGLSRKDSHSTSALMAIPEVTSSSSGSSSGSSSTSSTGSFDAATSASGLSGLYVALNQVQAQLRETQAVRATGQALIGGQLRDLSNVPTDDPLLADARSRVNQDQSLYSTLSRVYPPENLNVIQAKTRLDFDQGVLNRQIEGVKRNLTTPDVRSAEQVKGLYARQVALLGQIAQARRQLGVSRELSGEAGRRQTEVAIQLDVLKTTLSEAARVRLENASSLSRMNIIDAALPPKSGEPGLSKLAGVILVLVVLAFLVSIVMDYLHSVPGRPAEDHTLTPGSTNGAGTNGGGLLGAEDRADDAIQTARKQ